MRSAEEQFNTRIRTWVKITLGWLIVTALLGVLLRFYPYYSIPKVAYANLLHGHSHVAFLGWIFNGLFIFIVSQYLLSGENIRFYTWIFAGLQLSVTGMLLFFPLYGYNPLTISISAVHTILSMVFAIRFFLNRSKFKASRHQISYLTMGVALFFMLLSGVGPGLLAPISILGYKDTIWYTLAIYLYLHFQYNGWFLFGAAGLFFLMLESGGISFSARNARWFIWLNAVAVVPSYALSALWTTPPDWVYGAAVAGTSLQLISLVFLIRLLVPINGPLNKVTRSPLIHFLLRIAFITLIVRNIMQFTGSLPSFASMAAQHRYVVIGFLHLNFLGLVTMVLMAVLMQKNWVKRDSGLSGTGFILFFAGYLITELLLFLSPFHLVEGVPRIVLVLSIVMAAGIILWARGGWLSR